MKTPLFSLCTPTYGRGSYIGQTIDSVLKQTIADFEIIVVDDCSPDNTAEVVQSFSDKRIIYLQNDVNLGVPENLNKAMSLAKGQYLILLEDHDLLEPTYLEEMLKVMNRYPTVGFAASGLFTIDENNQPLERYVENLPEFMEGRKLLRRLLTRFDCPFSVTVTMRRTALTGVEPVFDAKYWWYADQYLWTRLAARCDFGYVAKPLLRFRTREDGHFLAHRFWESVLCLDRIHRDNWHLLHPRDGLTSKFDRLLFEKSKLRSIATMRAGKMLRNDLWTKEDGESAYTSLSFFGRVILNCVNILPLRAVSGLRSLYLKSLRARTKLNLEQAVNDVQPVNHKLKHEAPHQ